MRTAPCLRAIAWRSLAGALGLVLALAAPAGAHASLAAVDPPDGARLDESPEVVTLTFTEPVSADLGGVQVLAADGTQVQRGAARVDGPEVVVDLEPDLPPGTYVVSYRVVSADGHPVRGGSVFAVGAGPVDTGAFGRIGGTSGDAPWDVAGAVARWLSFVGVLTAAGGALFLVRAHRGGAERAALVRWVDGAALVGAVAALGALPVQAALGTGQGPGSLFDPGVLGDVAADGVGPAILLALTGLGLVVVGVRRSRAVTVAGALVASTSFALTGHTRVDPNAAVATVADALHLVAAAVWGGGLLLLWITVRSRHRRGRAGDAVDTADVVARFSSLATLAILAVGAAGVVLAWSQVERVGALWDTRYGLFLVGKLALVVGIAVVGTYNHVQLVPALRRTPAERALARLHLTLRFEAIGLAGLLAITSVLVFTTPARDRTANEVVERIVELDGAGSVQVVVSPARVGRNDVHLYTYDPDGRPSELAERVTVELSLPAAQLGPTDREADRAGPAHFTLDTSDFALAGEWQLTVRARLDRFTEVTGTTTVPIAS